MKKLLFVALCSLILTGFAVADDWPQFRGPQRTGISKETGLLKEWPKDGPPLAWKVSGLGGGFSAPSVAGGRIFGMSYRGDDEVVWALDEKDGKEQWATTIAPANKKIGYQVGPRCTPTVDGDLVYALGTAGELACLKVADGTQVWHKNMEKDFGGHFMAAWGYCESPLIDGDKLICSAGAKDAAVVALNKKTGEVIWKGVVPDGYKAGYASSIAIEAAGHKQYVAFLESGLAGFDAATGKLLWRFKEGANGTANASMPVFSDDCVFVTSAYGGGDALAKLTVDGKDGVKAEEVYATKNMKNMKNHHGGVILYDGCLYGADGGNPPDRTGSLVCLDFKTGEVKWVAGKERAPKGSTTLADGRLYYRQEDGTVMLIEPTPKEYIEHGRFAQPDRSRSSAWSYPVVANGKLYLRDQDVLFCYDIKEKAGASSR
jgi:outer membrane protein assembly factor BamB